MQNNHNSLYSEQFDSDIQLIYVSKETRDLEKFIYNYASSDYHNIDNTPSIIRNHPNHIDDRHDQSLLSLLIKKII
jgi:hypothetical protein